MDKESLYIRRLQKGDASSFEYLYNKWSGKLYNFVMRISRGDSYLAEELVQSIFIKVWEGRELLDADKSFPAYLCTIAKNQLSNIYQHRMLEFLYEEKIKQTSITEENNTEKEIEFRFLEDYINTLIDQLPPARQQIFLLSRKQLLSNREIAEKLNISENTVESQLTKALSFLRERIKSHYNLSIYLLFYMLHS